MSEMPNVTREELASDLEREAATFPRRYPVKEPRGPPEKEVRGADAIESARAPPLPPEGEDAPFPSSGYFAGGPPDALSIEEAGSRADDSLAPDPKARTCAGSSSARKDVKTTSPPPSDCVP